MQWASSCVFAVVNTQRRSNARGMAVEYLARKKALAAPEIQADDELKATGTKELAAAKEQLEKAIKRAYQHVAYLAQPDPEGERQLEQVTFDDEHSTSLDGTIVWKALAERDKVFDAGAFNAKALVHNLRDGDYGRTLSDLRASFYSAPRLPLLYAGDRDLQQAIYDAVAAGDVQIVDGSGDPVAVTAPNQVNLASAGLRLAKPKPIEPEAQPGGAFRMATRPFRVGPLPGRHARRHAGRTRWPRTRGRSQGAAGRVLVHEEPPRRRSRRRRSRSTVQGRLSGAR